jgi:hypothetical protein
MCAAATVSTLPATSFEFTATGVLGQQRNTMLMNELHLRDELGRSKKRGYAAYPGNSYRYGKANPNVNNGVADALKWNSGGNESRANYEFFSADELVPSGEETIFEQNKHKSDPNNNTHIKSTKAKQSAVKNKPLPDIAYGQTGRPSTPIQQLLEYKFQDDWLKRQRAMQLARAKDAQVKKLPPGAYRENYTSQLRSATNLPLLSQQQRPLWQMPKFTKSATANLDTFRSPSARDRALKHSCGSSPSRVPVNQQKLVY